jgi:hypothetical protein
MTCGRSTRTPNIARQVPPARERPFKARGLYHRKWREHVTAPTHPPFSSIRDSLPPQPGQLLPLFTGMRNSLASSIRKSGQNSWAIPLIALSVFLLGRPYFGIVHDGYIYIGRALADLDPNGVGRDLMFVHDGQFGFSVFRFAATALVALLGPALAAKALVFAAELAWFCAAAAFARQFTSGRAVWAVLIFTALLPASYGAPYTFGFAEPFAVPRPFSEALVLASLAALACGRNGVSLCGLIAASLMHPVMSLPGFAVYLVVLGVEDKRWFFFATLGLVVLIIGGAAGLPILDRLFTPVDPAFRGLFESRSPFLFPSLWPSESFCSLLVQTATIAIAAHLQQGRVRCILAAIILAGFCGIAVAAIFGDWLSSLLIVQLQPSRMVWLMSAAGAMALGACALKLWQQRPGGRIVLALLVLSWSFITQFEVASVAAILALYLHFGERRFEPLLKARFVPAIWLFTLAVSAIWQLRLSAFPWHFSMNAPEGYGDSLSVLVKYLLPLPVCALAVYFTIVRPRISPWLQSGFALLLAAAAVLSWDHRSPGQRMLETDLAPAEIIELINKQKGEILWIDGMAEAWFMLGRPQWASPLQGIPIIFSPALANEWSDRTKDLMSLRLADQQTFERWSEPKRADRPELSLASVKQLCARDDAPAWIIAPLEHSAAPLAGLQMTLWRLPEPQFKLVKADGDMAWQKIDAYGFIRCAKTFAEKEGGSSP